MNESGEEGGRRQTHHVSSRIFGHFYPESKMLLENVAAWARGSGGGGICSDGVIVPLQ